MYRRGLLGTLLAAPAIILTPGLLMPIKPVAKFTLSPADINALNLAYYNLVRVELDNGFSCTRFKWQRSALG